MILSVTASLVSLAAALLDMEGLECFGKTVKQEQKLETTPVMISSHDYFMIDKLSFLTSERRLLWV
jgi:hypothetical protein